MPHTYHLIKAQIPMKVRKNKTKQNKKPRKKEIMRCIVLKGSLCLFSVVF